VQINTTLSMRPALSPDGKLVAYWQKEDRSDAPWRIAISTIQDGKLVTQVDVAQSAANANSVIQWTPDSGSVLYIDYRNRVTNLLEQPITGGQTRTLTNFTREQFYSFDLSRDGRLVLSRGVRTNDAVLISESE